eukprot:321124-Pyramimonas_sp.AAC.1
MQSERPSIQPIPDADFMREPDPTIIVARTKNMVQQNEVKNTLDGWFQQFQVPNEEVRIESDPSDT